MNRNLDLIPNLAGMRSMGLKFELTWSGFNRREKLLCPDIKCMLTENAFKSGGISYLRPWH